MIDLRNKLLGVGTGPSPDVSISFGDDYISLTAKQARTLGRDLEYAIGRRARMLANGAWREDGFYDAKLESEVQ